MAAIGAAVGYIAWTGDVTESSEPAVRPSSATATLAEVRAEPHLMYRDTSLGASHGRLVLETFGGESPRLSSELSCERVHFAAGSGVCLTAERGFATVYRALTFDDPLAPLHVLSLAGVPSRVRVAPGGSGRG